VFEIETIVDKADNEQFKFCSALSDKFYS